MFCPQARILLSGVALCALSVGCAGGSSPSSVALNSQPRQVAIYSDVETASPGHPVTRQDIIDWSIHGISDDIIIDRVQHNPCNFHLSAGEEIELRDAGVSDEVIRTMKATAG